MGTWTHAEKTILPGLISKLKKREEPIRKEIKMHQDKIRTIETESAKHFQRKRAAEVELSKAREKLD